MRSYFLKTLAVASVVVAGVACMPATSSATALASQAHVNSNISYTWLYVSQYGDTHYNIQLGPCVNFWYDSVSNGRYHDITDGGWVSTDKAGPGWC
jgi:hypothetical protein